MKVLPYVYLTYMFIALYLLIFYFLLYFRNKQNLYDCPKLTVFLVVTKNHVSPGISLGLFLLEHRKKVFIEI